MSELPQLGALEDELVDGRHDAAIAATADRLRLLDPQFGAFEDRAGRECFEGESQAIHMHPRQSTHHQVHAQPQGRGAYDRSNSTPT